MAKPVFATSDLSRKSGDIIAGRLASEIPEIEKRRTGLDPSLRLWIVLDEANIDVIGKSYYLMDQEPMGHFSRPYLIPLAKEFAKHFRSAMKVDRTR